jgi:Amt family ammonium transporter
MVTAYPTWLSPGDNAWQLTAATLVGLMSVPGLVVLYGGVMQKRWAINSMMLVFCTFSIVLIVWVLWAFKMSFGHPIGSGLGFFSTFIGHPGDILSHSQEQGQANIPLIGSAGPAFRFPESTLAYFQFVFAAITPILALGSVLGRINIKAWIPFTALWITFVYSVDAFLIWGGGWFAHKGAIDFSGGYVIHLSAGITGFVAAAVIGPRTTC